MSVDFGKFKKEGEETTTERTSAGTTEVPQPTKVADRGRKDYKKLYNETRVELDKIIRKYKKFMTIEAERNDELRHELEELKVWADAVKKEETQMHELTDEIYRLKVQGNMDKKALDHVTMQLTKFQFDPQKFSQLAQVLTYLRVHGNKQALIRIKEIVGTTELGAVRKWIFDLLEAPYK